MSLTPQSPASAPASRPLSRGLVALVSTLFTAGVSLGWASYLHKAATRVAHVPGTNAWWQQAGAAAVTTAIIGLIWRRRRRGQAGPRWLLAPLGQAAAVRLSVLRRPASLGRAMLALPLALLFGYGFVRAGYQVTSGLNPANTVNAWGGPSYLGALACHYLDLFLLMMVAAWLLDRLLPRPEGRPAPAVASPAAYDSVRDL